jgi:hypothetical protein
MGAMNRKYVGYAILVAIAVLAAWAATTPPAPFLLHH